MSSPSVTKKSLRKNSSSFTLLDIQKLIAESKERIISHVNNKFEQLCAKIETLETSVKEVKAVQIQQETDIMTIKEVVAHQQSQIEQYEERARQCNLIISNLPESAVTIDNVPVTDDVEKFVALANSILPPDDHISEDDIKETMRLGQRGGRNTRIMKVKFSEVQSRNNILRHCKNLNQPTILSSFGRVFINKDMSYLRRCEEKRLRGEYKLLRSSYPDAYVRLRNGKLFLGPAVKDCIDFRNQLF